MRNDYRSMLLVMISLLLASAGSFAGGAAAQGPGLFNEYGVYSVTPKNPDYGLGAIMLGYFERDGSALRNKQLICRSRIQMQPDEIKDCRARQVGLSNAKNKGATIDITSSIKRLLEASVGGRYINRASLTVSDACIFELDLREAQKALEEDPDCLALARNERRKLANETLSKKLGRPGEYLLIWQTTRVLHGDIVYTVDFDRSASLSLRTKAAEELKDLGGAVSGGISSGQKLELKGTGIWLGILPRYYEEWYLDRAGGKAINAAVAKTAKATQSGARALNTAAVEAAGKTVDAKIESALASKKK